MIPVRDAATLPVELGVRSVTVLEGISLNIESLSGAADVEAGAEAVAEEGTETAPASGVGDELELGAEIGVEAGIEAGVEAGVERGAFDTTAFPEADTAGFAGWLAAIWDCS